MQPDPPQPTVLYTLEQTIKAYRRLCQQNIDQVITDLTVDQGLTLMVLSNYPALSQQRLAELVFKDKASITRIIELLVQKGLLARAAHPTDKRKSDLRITDGGRQTLARLSPTIQLNQQTALQGLSAAELAQFDATLRKILANCSPAQP
ncbi:MarR family transcriptional regulator [Hymenobacter gummosus]|uniref:MarR family transcriptional regulator n=1 Tax=Hymenobacter gummosus TaxID=1776032 RepID=A0A431TZ94_9BACT|nr:MarR family transcriptional regulator [Hymenobacter gummosus]RTQ47770.1 MarR family transcriptional regulator [Hymenobacter gummosus]